MFDAQNQGLESAPPSTPSTTSLLTDQEVAAILTVSIDWVRSHASEIPGLQRLGSYYRFHPGALAIWLGSLDPLLNSEQIAPRMRVPVSWVYANAKEIPGFIPLGRYVRFRPTVFNQFIAGSEACQ